MKPNNLNLSYPPSIFRILSSVFFLVTSFSFSQTTTNSPYSIFGIGDLETSAFSSSIAMGNAKYAVSFPYSINISNPASYGTLTLPTFDVGFSSNFIALSYKDEPIKKINNTYFKYMAFAFPVSKRWWASSFGIVPYSKMGYNIFSKDSSSNFGTTDYTYKGSGGISRFFIGNSFNFLKDSVQQFSFGTNISYLFGSFEKINRAMPEASLLSYNIKTQSTVIIGDFLFDAGALYSKKINKNWNISLGADYEFAKNLNAENVVITESYIGSGLVEDVKDTIAFDSIAGTIDIPGKIGFGFSFSYKGKWLFAADYSVQDWTEFNYLGKNPGLMKQQQYALGIQYNYNATERENILRMMWYRMGFRFANTPLFVKNHQLNESAITLGVGIPIGEKSKGSFNLSMETGIRGENKNGLTGEQFTNLIFGFSFTPSYYDRWFLKPKID